MVDENVLREKAKEKVRKFTPRPYYRGDDTIAQVSLVKEYRCIAMDPPWDLRGAGKSKRGADRHYETLTTVEILDVIRKSGVFNPHENAHLWMWTINGYLPDGLWLMDQLGFRFIKVFTWAKADAGPGMGYYGRDDSEQLLFGVRGKLPPLESARRVRTTIRALRGRHSEKPAKAYTEVIEKISPGPRLEMFARDLRPGWEVWGNDPKVLANAG